MNYRLLSLVENPPEGFQYSPNLAQRDVRRWPFALLASSREEAERILAPFGSSLAGIIVTFGPRYTWHQCAQLLFHLTVPYELQANFEQLLLSHLSLLDNWQQAENRSIEQTLKFQRAREESYRSRQEFALVKESLMEELSIRRQVEETLREREAHYRLLTEDVADVVWKADRDYRLTYISPADERLRGYKAEEVIGRHALELFTEEAIAELTETLRQRQVAELSGIRTGTITFEAQHPCKDGSLVWAEINSTPERGVDGTIIGYHGISREITKRKYTENKFRMLFDLSPIGMAMVDNETGEFLEVNDAVLRPTGYTKDEFLKLSFWDITPREYEAQEQEQLRQLSETGRFGPNTKEYIRKDGTRYPISISGVLFVDTNKRQVVWGIIEDISERKTHENEQLKMEKLKSVGILAGGIAHDFNNILTGIIGNITLAQMYLESTHKACRPLAEAEKASARATELANQLLTFARGGEPIKKIISLRRIVDESLSLVLHGSNVKGQFDIPDTVHAINADEGQLSQVFNNMFINATQSMPGGGILTVTAKNKTLDKSNTLGLPPGTYVQITCSDVGCGISEDLQKRIFDPYFTTKSAGTGLGLASVLSIITRHSGHIGVSSEPGKGTTFTIYLPSTGTTYSAYQSESVVQNSISHQGGSILVMDDEELIRDLTTELLEYLGYSVTTCENGVEAVNLYKSARESDSPFSAVIMDLTIPGSVGGRETAEQIRAFDPNACLIVSSGYSNDPIMADYATYGFSGAVSKPYKIADLSQLISTLLSAHQ